MSKKDYIIVLQENKFRKTTEDEPGCLCDQVIFK